MFRFFGDPVRLLYNSPALCSCLKARAISSFYNLSKPHEPEDEAKRREFLLNRGKAIRVLREDIPRMLDRDLDWSIYAKDVVFRDAMFDFSFAGLRKYRWICRSIRWVARGHFSETTVQLDHISELSENVFLIKWTLVGKPRRFFIWRPKFREIETYEAFFIYKFNGEGFVCEHILDKVIPPPRLIASLKGLGRWQAPLGIC